MGKTMHSKSDLLCRWVILFWFRVLISPATPNKHVGTSAMDVMWRNPDCARAWTWRPMAPFPNPASMPDPYPGKPNIGGSRRYCNLFYDWWRWGFRNDDLASGFGGLHDSPFVIMMLVNDAAGQQSRGEGSYQSGLGKHDSFHIQVFDCYNTISVHRDDLLIT